MVALGLDVEHAIVFLNDEHFDGIARGNGVYDESADPVHDVRILLALRVGGGSRRLVGYGLIAPGLGVGAFDGDVNPGFAMGVGAGVWGIVWRGLFLGAEVGTDVMALGTRDGGVYEDAGTALMLDVRALLGWRFRWTADE